MAGLTFPLEIWDYSECKKKVEKEKKYPHSKPKNAKAGRTNANKYLRKPIAQI
jgi:hypothetical protein